MILIPTVDEYRSAGLGDLMWWSEVDYKSFKESAVEELRRYLQENSKTDAKSALKILYQPDKAKIINESSPQLIEPRSNPSPSGCNGSSSVRQNALTIPVQAYLSKIVDQKAPMEASVQCNSKQVSKPYLSSSFESFPVPMAALSVLSSSAGATRATASVSITSSNQHFAPLAVPLIC